MTNHDPRKPFPCPECEATVGNGTWPIKRAGYGLFGSTYLRASDAKTVPLVMESATMPHRHMCRCGDCLDEAMKIAVRLGAECGPGISAIPKRPETLAFLDEDLLCEDE